MDDRELLVGIRQKDEKCFEKLMEKYIRYIAAIIAKVAGQRLNKYDIEDVCSDTLIKLWVNSEKIDLKSDNLKGYLAISARNNTLNAIRSKQKRLGDELDEDSLADDSAEVLFFNWHDNQKINELITTLPELDREIMIRRYFYLERVKDIAQKVGINEKAVSARIGRAKEKLKCHLSKYILIEEPNRSHVDGS